MIPLRRKHEGYHGRIAANHDNGGHCDLTLDADRFELRIVRYAPYSIEDGDTFRGVYTQSEEALVLEARPNERNCSTPASVCPESCSNMISDIRKMTIAH